MRIFGALKDRKVDRQIGDRRGRNALECRQRGPSSILPSGSDLCDLAMNLQTQCVRITITDRRDFYRQIKCTESRAVSNTIGPAIPAEMLTDTKAFSHYFIRTSRKKYARLSHGDQLGGEHAFVPGGDCIPSILEGTLVGPGRDQLWVSFGSVLQGDHLGVEIATRGHANLLKSAELLDERFRMVACRPQRCPDRAEGLVIDDFFSLSVEPKREPSRTLQSI